MPTCPQRNYTLPFTNAVNTARVAERVSELVERRILSAQAPSRHTLEQVAMGEVRTSAGREQAEFAALGEVAEIIDGIDAQIARLALNFSYSTPDRDEAIRAYIENRPALLSRATYHNQLAATYLAAIHWGNDERRAELERTRDIHNDALPYFVALNDAGRKLLAELNARFSKFQMAAE